jgi:hypothetical protein
MFEGEMEESILWGEAPSLLLKVSCELVAASPV